MSNDLLFSVLPRRGTVPVKTERGEVKKIDKKTPIHGSPEEENIPVVNEREQKQSNHQRDSKQESGTEHQAKDYSDEHAGLIVDTTDDEQITQKSNEQSDVDVVEEYSADGKEEDDDDHKGINLDVTV